MYLISYKIASSVVLFDLNEAARLYPIWSITIEKALKIAIDVQNIANNLNEVVL